jgi:hypothetical protein
MDTHIFASLAQLRILVIPVGTIPQSTFTRYAADIRSFESIRLGDLPENKHERGGSQASTHLFLSQFS